ncbi:MAG: TetR family transcriptional regulator [Clostridia bacterium]|nr:TetR family transcriptional regulator [Clostridia bacterium]
MPKGSPALTSARKEEIVSACARLYETKSFKDITLKDIGGATSFTRTSIYNYFQTKEEIFLALLARQYRLWVQDLDALIQSADRPCRADAIDRFASSLAKRKVLLKLLSMNHYDMEENSRTENLVEFKVAYGASLDAVRRYLAVFFDVTAPADADRFIYAFFPFMFGIYPYTEVTEKQAAAMQCAGVSFARQSIYDLIYHCVDRLL